MLCRQKRTPDAHGDVRQPPLADKSPSTHGVDVSDGLCLGAFSAPNACKEIVCDACGSFVEPRVYLDLQGSVGQSRVACGSSVARSRPGLPGGTLPKLDGLFGVSVARRFQLLCTAHLLRRAGRLVLLSRPIAQRLSCIIVASSRARSVVAAPGSYQSSFVKQHCGVLRGAMGEGVGTYVPHLFHP